MGNSEKRSAPLRRIQFTIIGMANAIVDIGTLNLLLFLFPADERSTLVLFNTIAYALAVVNSYVWNSFITFGDRSKGSARQRILFALQGLVSLGINNGVFLSFNALFRIFGFPAWIHYNLAKGIAMFASFSASYFMMKYFVFRKFKNRTR